MISIDVQWSDRYVHRPSGPAALPAFCRSNGVERVPVTTRAVRETVTYDGIAIDFIPAARLSYDLGRPEGAWSSLRRRDG